MGSNTLVISHSRLHLSDSSWAPQQFRLFPLWSLLGIFVGCTLADLLIPEIGYQPAHALTASALALSAGLLAGPLYAGMNNPASLLRAESILSVGLVYWITLDALQGSYGLWGTSYEGIRTAFIGTALFAGSMWVGSVIGTRNRSSRIGVFAGDFPPRVILVVGLITFAAGILQPMMACKLNPGCLVSAFFLPWDLVPWRTYSIGDSGSGLNTLFRYIGYLGFLTLPLAVALMRVQGRVSWSVVLLSILGALLLLLLIQSGARRIVGMVIAATALVWILLHPRVRLRHLLKLLAVCIGILLVLEAMVSWRTIGFGTGLTTAAPITGQTQGSLSLSKNLYYMTQAMTVVPERHPYKGVEGLKWALGGPIPKSVWPSKPASRGVDLLPLIGSRKSNRFSWSCSAVCDFYLMGGMWVIAAGGLLFGILARACNRLLFQPPTVRSRLLYGFGVMVLFIGLRNIRDLTSTGFFVLLGILFFVVGLRVLARLSKTHHARPTGG